MIEVVDLNAYIQGYGGTGTSCVDLPVSYNTIMCRELERRWLMQCYINHCYCSEAAVKVQGGSDNSAWQVFGWKLKYHATRYPSFVGPVNEYLLNLED